MSVRQVPRLGSTVETGQLDQRVRIIRRTGTRDAYGDPVPTEADVQTRWASIRQLAGTELLVAQQINAQAQYEVVMRHTTNLTAKDFLKLRDGRKLEIVSPPDNVNFKKDAMRLMCKESTVGG